MKSKVQSQSGAQEEHFPLCIIHKQGLLGEISAMEFPWLRCCSTEWNPADVKVTMNLVLEASIEAVNDQEARLSFGHVVVLDNFITDEMGKALLELITEKGQ